MNQKKVLIGAFNWRTRLLSNGTKKYLLTIINITKLKSKDGSWLYKIKCDCGKEKLLTRTQFNRTQSCGCMHTKRLQKEKGEVSLNVLYTSYKSRCKKKGINFYLTKIQFRTLISKNCAYCNIGPKDYNTYVTDGNKSKAINTESINRAWIKANGIDRVNNNFGYNINNCVPCCEHCNRAKLDWTFEEFLVKVKDIYEFLNLNKFEKNKLNNIKFIKKSKSWGGLE